MRSFFGLLRGSAVAKGESGSSSTPRLAAAALTAALVLAGGAAGALVLLDAVGSAPNACAYGAYSAPGSGSTGSGSTGSGGSGPPTTTLGGGGGGGEYGGGGGPTTTLPLTPGGEDAGKGTTVIPAPILASPNFTA